MRNAECGRVEWCGLATQACFGFHLTADYFYVILPPEAKNGKDRCFAGSA